MQPLRFLLLTATLCGVLGLPMQAQDRGAVILGTTTSTYDSGLLDSILPIFERNTGIRVKVIAVGTGAALAMAARGDVDAVLVHAPERELEQVRSGALIEGRLIMHNDFVLLGPPDDPAGVRQCRDLACAMQTIAERGTFVSWGDRSGTHEMELKLWTRAGIPLERVTRRLESGQGMGATLEIAVQRQAYALSDRGTFLAHSAARQQTIVFAGDPLLLNIYHAYVVNPERYPRTNRAEARALVDFLGSAVGQEAIGGFGRARFGRPLFIPDAGRDTTRLHEAEAGRER